MLAMIGAVSLPDCKLGGEVHSAPLLHLGGQTASRLRGKEELCCQGGQRLRRGRCATPTQGAGQ